MEPVPTMPMPRLAASSRPSDGVLTARLPHCLREARAELYPVFLKLIDVDERGVASRRRAQRDDLVGAAGRAACWSMRLSGRDC